MSKESRDFKLFALNGKLLGIKVDKDARTVHVGKEGGFITGATAVVEESGAVSARFTATRIALMGPFALAFKKKKDQRSLYLTLESPEFLTGVEISVKDEQRAREWAREFNKYSRNAE